MMDDAYRVLVIDDDPDIAEYTGMILTRRAGCEVETINDPMLAAGRVESFLPDVVITDIEMPGMSGLELISAVRRTRPGLPVIVMTGRVSLDYAMSAMSNQADEFLTKPIPTGKLLETVVRLADRWRLQTQADKESTRAAEVQRGLLPKQIVDLPGYDLIGGCVTARNVGGDFYDWYPARAGVAFTLADVMGKGVGAAIIAATVRAVIRAGSASEDLSVAISAASAALEADLEQTGAFVTVFHGRLDTGTGEVRYIDAGHGLSLVVRSDGGSERLATPSFPLGTGLGSSWQEQGVVLAPGDTLVSVSDGVLDMWDGTLGALDEVEAMLRSASTVQEFLDLLLGMASAGADDDVSAIVLRRH
jgi:sigma-B regulation protein RsbU (phosphoserine phosphatase)